MGRRNKLLNPDVLAETVRERQTIRAALLSWWEENVPHTGVQEFYFDSPDPDPLTGDEIDALRSRLDARSPR